MADTPRTFYLRVISGVLGAAAILSAIYFYGTRGTLFATSVAVVLSIREYSRMAFLHWKMPPSVVRAYWLICAGLFALLFLQFAHSLILFAFANLLFFCAALWLARGKVTNENLLAAIAMGCFGLLYCVLFPFFACRMALLPSGTQWFLLLLLVVFFGDIFAYFGGRWFGRHKMMVNISPNKTWEGAGSGLVGSTLAGLVLNVAVFQDVPLYKTALFCVFCGMVAQSGDLLISLVKRVAQVKDSGHIMPGHGGILDRLDGVFIACPIVYAFAIYVHPL